MPNKLDIDFDISGAKAKTAELKAEMAQLIQQANQLKSVLADVTGAQRAMVQGALAGIVSRMGEINSSLGTAQNSAFFGGSNGSGANVGGVGIGGGSGGGSGSGGTGAAPFGSVPPGWGHVTNMGAPGFKVESPIPAGWSSITNMGWQGTAQMAPAGWSNITASGNYNAANAPTMAMPTMAMSQAQMAAANYRYGQGARPFGEFDHMGFSRYGVQAAAGAGYLAADAAGQLFNYQAQRIMGGGVDYQAQGRGVFGSIGGAIGGVLGGIGGSVFGPIGTAAGIGVGIGVGSGLGNAFGNMMGATPQSRADANVSMMSFFGARFGGNGLDMARSFTNPTFEGVGTGVDAGIPKEQPGRFGRIRNTINRIYGGGELETSLTQVAATFGTIAGNLFNYGIDPFGPGENTTYNYRPFLNAGRERNRQGFRAVSGGNFRDAFEDILATQRHIMQRETGGTAENLAETYTRRLGLMFGKESPEAAKRIAPGFDPFLGGNVADVLGQLGATDTLAYLRVQHPDLSTGGISPELLSSVSGTSRANQRNIAFARIRPTESGAAAMFGYDEEMANISRLPGGRKSLAYAQAYSGFRGARMEDFQQQTMSGFGLRDLQLQGEQKRQEYMPFAPGNIFATSLGIISNNRRQIGAIQGQLNLPDLSEQERYSLTAQQQGLMTENARNVGMLSEGFENRLPALAAGRPNFFGRYNSAMGAAINLGRIGSPVRAYGAASGSQAAMQDQFVRGLGGDFPGATGPMSRTQDLNATNSILERILGAILKSNGPMAPGKDRHPGRPDQDPVGAQQDKSWNSR